jgi:hypothetical protein
MGNRANNRHRTVKRTGWAGPDIRAWLEVLARLVSTAVAIYVVLRQ